MTKTQLVAHLAELPADAIADFQFLCAGAVMYYRESETPSKWASIFAEAIELKKHQYTDFDEVDSNPIGI